MKLEKTIFSGLLPGLLAATFLAPPVLNAQETDDVYEISPFQVDGSGDDRYRAGSTLAGTRLNSNLGDVAAAISPFTKEFINDIGADSVEELLAYSNNTVRLDESELANGNQVLEFEFQFNIRGLPATRARNYFLADTMSMDNFNVERVDESRGPNSILFGVGSAGGVVNTSTKRARFTEINEVLLMVGSNSQFRTAIDFNRELVEDTFAIRLNAMYDTDESWRMWEFKDQERIALAATWKLSENTTVRGEMETGEIEDNLGRSYLAEDHTSEWIAEGMLDRSTTTGGAYNGSRNNAWINTPADGTTYFSSGGGRAYHYNVPGSRDVLVTEESTLFQQGLIDWAVNPGGPDNTRLTEYTTWSVFLEQRIGETLNIEAAFNHLDTYFNQYDTTSNGYRLRADITDPAQDARTINHTGEYFYESLWTRRWRDRIADTARVTASYEPNIDEKWGRHRFAAMYETQDANPKRESSFQFLANDEGILATPTAPGSISANGRNSIWQRNYITPGDFSTYTTGSWKNPVSVDIDGDNYTAQFFPRNANVTDDDVGLDSLLISMQNFWLDGRVITTFGYREDDITIEKRGQTTHPSNQRIVVDYDTPPEKYDFSGGTTTLGLVVKPTDWLSLLYNDSDNQGLPDVNKIVLPSSNFADPSEGEGKDYGIMLNLMEGRVFARIARYESSMFGLADFGNRGNVESPNIRNIDTLLNAGLITQAERDAREVVTNTFTFGRASEGYEAEVTANLSENWSLRFNYSKTERIRFNIMPEVLAWYPDQDAFWRSFGDDVYFNNGDEGPGSGPYTPPSGNDSIAEESDRIQRHINNRTAFDGLGDQGSRGESANVFTNYRFLEGPLSGFNIGGGVRHLGAMTVGVDISTGTLIWGNDKTLFDLLAGYRYKATNALDIRFQLNVRNLFDEKDYTIAGVQLDGRLDSIRLETPREYQFRTTFSW